MSYINDFFAIGLISLLGVISPGPDFIIITQKALKQGRRAALIAVCGVATGLTVHVTYCIAGLGLLLLSSELMFSTIQIIGALYLIYLGIQAFIPSRSPKGEASPKAGALVLAPGHWFVHYRQGLLVNLLNLKAALFTMGLFAQFVRPDMPLSVEIGLGLEMVLITIVWFAFIAWAFTVPQVSEKLQRYQGVFDKLMGGCLVLLGLKLFTLKGGL